mgnify:CR=1 FL=1
MRGHECWYVCADDAHGTPIMLRAQQEGVTPDAAAVVPPEAATLRSSAAPVETPNPPVIWRQNRSVSDAF